MYRHYATLYFVFAVDSSESELGILDLIQVFVETLDQHFGNVCELDLIFHIDKVHHILDEMVMGGMVLETSRAEILTHIEQQEKAVKSEVCHIQLPPIYLTITMLSPKPNHHTHTHTHTHTQRMPTFFRCKCFEQESILLLSQLTP